MRILPPVEQEIWRGLLPYPHTPERGRDGIMTVWNAKGAVQHSIENRSDIARHGVQNLPDMPDTEFARDNGLMPTNGNGKSEIVTK